MKDRIFTRTGFVLIGAGVVLNPWLLAALFSPDGALAAATRNAVLAMDLMMILTGLLLVRYKSQLPGIYVSLLSLIFILGLCEGTFRILDRYDKLKFKMVNEPGRKVGLFEYDEKLGWRNRAGFDDNVTWPHRVTREKINSDGWRDHEYQVDKAENTYRVAVLGCSFTYGYGVNTEETYVTQLEEMLNTEQDEKEVEVLNFGVMGFGIDQMLLNYENYVRKYQPDLVIMQYGFFNSFRAMYQKMWLTPKPAFVLEDDELVLKNYPVPRSNFRGMESWLIQNSTLYKFIKEKILILSESLKLKENERVATNKKLHHLSTEIFRRLKGKTKQDSVKLVVFIWDKERNSAGWLREICAKAGVEAFDLDRYADREEWSGNGGLLNPMPVGHWSPAGHEFVATAIYNYLKQHHITPFLLTGQALSHVR